MAFHPNLFSRRSRVLVACIAMAGGLSLGSVQAAPFSGFAPQRQAGIVLVRDGYGHGGGHHPGRDRGLGEQRNDWDHPWRRDHERHGWGYHRRPDWGHHHHHGSGYGGDHRY